MSSRPRTPPARRDSRREDVDARFKTALLDFADEPSVSNLARYLQASRALGSKPKAASRR